MDRRHALKALAGLIACPLCMSAFRADAWDYENQTAWPGICTTGVQQSPIDIVDAVDQELPAIELQWNQPATTIEKNPETVKISFPGGSILLRDEATGASKQYTLRQMHFHQPAEHLIGGTRAKMEAHFVHEGVAPTTGLAVIGVLLNGGGSNATFASAMAQMPATNTERDVTAPIDPLGLLPPAQGRYFSYDGSLTTPTGGPGKNDCTENVSWMVLEQPVLVADADIATFTSKFTLDARNWQRKSLLDGSGNDVSVLNAARDGKRVALTVGKSRSAWNRVCVQVGDAWLCFPQPRG